MKNILSCAGALALELAPETRAQHPVLSQAAAGELATRVARDLAKFIPQAAELDLTLIGGLFDPVELLRPGWPLHAELERLTAQAPDRAMARVIAFGAAADGALPASLRPHPDYAEGPLRLLPFLLRGEAATVAAVGAHFEQVLLETGMAAADTALLAQESFSASIEHARYLTVHDLAAMMAMQYEHAGLAAVWPLIETALLAPEEEHWLDAPPEPLVRVADGQARIALFDDEGWLGSGFAPPGADLRQLARSFDRFQMRQRQIAALLQAHGIPVSFDHSPKDGDPRSILRA